MKKERSWVALVLVFHMLCTLGAPVRAVEERDFSDVRGHYAQSAIETWSGYGVLQGYPDGTFLPDGTMTRAELAAVLDRLMGYRETAENIYPDVFNGKWYTGSILHMAAQGIYTGDRQGQMNPNAPITRQEVFVALSRALWLEKSEEAPGFVDDGAIANWAGGYVAAMKKAGYISGDKNGYLRPASPITRAEVVTILERMVGGFVREGGVYTESCSGNLVVNAGNVTLKNMTVEGDLIVADGVAEGDVYLEGVTVRGNIILRGCGENSFHIMPGCQVKNVIVTKTTGGRIRLVNESGETIPMIFVNDGVGGVTLDGGELGNVVVACDVPVAVKAKKVQTLSITGNAAVTVEKNVTVAQVEVGHTAQDARLTINGRVTALVNDAGAAVTNHGVIGAGNSSGGSGSSGGGSSSGSGSASTPKVISEVSLQLLAPRFGETPDTADVLGVGYTARTVWYNADGSQASYRWKADSETADTFTADQAYQAVITLTPTSGYSFADTLRVKVTDGKDDPTDYAPTQVTANGKDRVVTMTYDETEHRDPVSGVSIVAPAAVDLGGAETLRVSWWDNLLVDPATYTYQWYRCSDGSGNGKEAIAGATEREYIISEGETRQEGMLYYCCEINAMGRSFLSRIREVEVRERLDLSTIPVPTCMEPMVMENGRWIELRIMDLMRHKNVSYSVMLRAEIIKEDGTMLGGSVDIMDFDYNMITEDDEVFWQVDMTELLNEYIFTMMQAGFSYNMKVGNVMITVMPRYKGEEVPDKAQEQVFGMAEQTGFHIYTGKDELPEELQALQLKIRSSGGTFVNKNDPDSDPAPAGKYERVAASFRKTADWVDETMEGYRHPWWEGELYIPNLWLDGFTTGESMSQVICLFYTGEGLNGEMNVYGVEFTLGNILFQSGNE